jgi:hypothetical protein
LSWRVKLLPYLEQDHLYRQFKLNEPWDSPHNQALLKEMAGRLYDPLSHVRGSWRLCERQRNQIPRYQRWDFEHVSLRRGSGRRTLDETR